MLLKHRRIFSLLILSIFTSNLVSAMIVSTESTPVGITWYTHQDQHYASYNELATDILSDYFRADLATQETVNLTMLKSIANHLGQLPGSNNVLRKSDARALSILGCTDGNLLNALNKDENGNHRTLTYTGMLQLANMLTNPEINSPMITSRQKCLQELSTNNTLRTEIQMKLSKLINCEPAIYNLFEQNKGELPELQRRHYFQNMIILNRIFNTDLNTSPKILNTSILLTKAWYACWLYASMYSLPPFLAMFNKILKEPGSTAQYFKEASREVKLNVIDIMNNVYLTANLYALYKSYKEIKENKGTLTACTQTILSPFETGNLMLQVYAWK